MKESPRVAPYTKGTKQMQIKVPVLFIWTHYWIKCSDNCFPCGTWTVYSAGRLTAWNLLFLKQWILDFRRVLFSCRQLLMFSDWSDSCSNIYWGFLEVEFLVLIKYRSQPGRSCILFLQDPVKKMMPWALTRYDANRLRLNDPCSLKIKGRKK